MLPSLPLRNNHHYKDRYSNLYFCRKHQHKNCKWQNLNKFHIYNYKYHNRSYFFHRNQIYSNIQFHFLLWRHNFGNLQMRCNLSKSWDSFDKVKCHCQRYLPYRYRNLRLRFCLLNRHMMNRKNRLNRQHICSCSISNWLMNCHPIFLLDRNRLLNLHQILLYHLNKIYSIYQQARKLNI